MHTQRESTRAIYSVATAMLIITFCIGPLNVSSFATKKQSGPKNLYRHCVSDSIISSYRHRDLHSCILIINCCSGMWKSSKYLWIELSIQSNKTSEKDEKLQHVCRLKNFRLVDVSLGFQGIIDKNDGITPDATDNDKTIFMANTFLILFCERKFWWIFHTLC